MPLPLTASPSPCMAKGEEERRPWGQLMFLGRLQAPCQDRFWDVEPVACALLCWMQPG